MSAKDVSYMDETRDETGAAWAGSPESPESTRRRVDPLSLVAGLVFIAVALAALTDRYWADIDAALVFGGAIVAMGVALMVSAVLRHRRRGQHAEGLAG